MNKSLIIICGPTGVGKSEVSLALAKQFGAEIVSADSQQVYKGMDLGTAKLASSLRSQVKHYLIDEVSPCDPFDAAIFVQHADKAIADIQARNKRAFIVGGTGLYIKALLFGLCAAPARDEVFRQQLAIEMQRLGSAYFHQQLAKKDPEAALSIHPNDTSRIVRALEICHVTQKTASEFYQAHKFGECKYPFLKIGLKRDRAILYENINQRVEKMMAQGLLAEVEQLLAQYGKSPRAFLAVGYRELILHLEGKLSLEDAVELIKRNSRRYAKRQLTWFNGDKEINWFEPEQLDEIAKLIQQATA